MTCDQNAVEVAQDWRTCAQCGVPAPTGMCEKCDAFVYDPDVIYADDNPKVEPRPCCGSTRPGTAEGGHGCPDCGTV